MQSIQIPNSVDDSTKLQKIINTTGNTPAKYEFGPEHEIEINSLIRVFNFTEWSGGGCQFTLKENISTSIFGNGIPLIAPKYPLAAEGLIFHDLKFDGNRDNQAGVVKLYPKPWGRGFHNVFMLGAINNVSYANSKNCEFYNIDYKNSLGDLLRVEGGSNIIAHDITASRGGHDVICFVVDGGEIYNIKADLAVNAGVRTRSAKNVKIHDCQINGGTKIANCPGIQIQSTAKNWISSGIEIYNNYIHDTDGPGIQIVGNVPDNGTVSIHNNLITGCGAMPASEKLPNVGGIVFDGFDVDIINNTLDKNYGYGIEAGDYNLSSTYNYDAVIKRNIVTNTGKALYPGKGSGSGIANMLGSRYSLTMKDNCVFNSDLSNHYQLPFDNYIKANPLYVSDTDYHLQKTSPCILQDSTIGCYEYVQDEPASEPNLLPSVIIHRRSESELKAFIRALRASGYLEEEEIISFLNVSDDFSI